MPLIPMLLWLQIWSIVPPPSLSHDAYIAIASYGTANFVTNWQIFFLDQILNALKYFSQNRMWYGLPVSAFENICINQKHLRKVHKMVELLPCMQMWGKFVLIIAPCCLYWVIYHTGHFEHNCLRGGYETTPNSIKTNNQFIFQFIPSAANI